jgi:hypothetical protein
MHEEQERGQIKVAGSTVYVLNDERKPSNLWSANVQPGRDDEGQRLSQEACEAVAQQIAASLAKPQPVGGALTDEVILSEAREWGLHGGDASEVIGFTRDMLKRATLSAPVAQPGAEQALCAIVFKIQRAAQSGKDVAPYWRELYPAMRALAAPAQAAAVEHPDTERFRKALEQVKYRDASLADAQVTALRALLAFDDEYPRSQAAAVPEAVACDIANCRHIRERRAAPPAGISPAVKTAVLAMGNAGALLSNCAFNLAQRKGGEIDQRTAETLDECRKGWDAAWSNLRAALSQGDVSGEGEGS